MPTPTTERLSIPGVAGDLVGVLMRPAHGAGRRPAVAVLPEVDGLSAPTEGATRRLADAGYVALALDLYAPFGGAPPLRNAADTLAWTGRLNDYRQLSDLSLALDWLAARPGVDPDRLGVVGFSIGGRYGLLASTEPRHLRAVVTFYTRIWPSPLTQGTIISPGDHVHRFGAPVCSIFGSEDELVPLDMVDRYRRLLEPQPDSELHLTEGNHLFMHEDRRRYRPASAERAWGWTLDFLGRHLAAEGP